MARHTPAQTRVQTAADDLEAVDYRHGNPWDFGLVPDMLRRVAACTKARIAKAEHWPAPQPA